MIRFLEILQSFTHTRCKKCEKKNTVVREKRIILFFLFTPVIILNKDSWILNNNHFLDKVEAYDVVCEA